MEARYLGLIISIISFIACAVLFYYKKSARVFYVLMSLSWLGGILYYGGNIFFKSMHESLDSVILYQYILFSGWFVNDAINNVFLSIRKSKRIRLLLGRIKTWKTQL